MISLKKMNFRRRTWVTHENFENMYGNVYKTIVEAGFAEEQERAIQHNAGLPSKYKLTRPKYMLFVDETVCNINQLNDGRVGGKMFILPKTDSECGAPTGATTDLHYTVLPFISGARTDEAVLCAIIFKSKLYIRKNLISWKTGIDITKDIDNEATVMHGELSAFFK
jgi:hypothetical protein